MFSEQNWPSSEHAANLPQTMRLALALLAKADGYARRTGGLREQFAVEIEELLACGATRSDLRWLVVNGYAEHYAEITRSSDPVRKFRKQPNTRFGKSACFALTTAGEALAGTLPNQTAETPSFSWGRITPAAAAGSLSAHKPTCPQWDPMHRLLSVDGQIVKRFRLTAPNQELVLTVFQEEGWPSRIDDPLPPRVGLLAKIRLRDTIKFLNLNLDPALIHFRGDGTGAGIIWEWADQGADSLGRPRRLRAAA